MKYLLITLVFFSCASPQRSLRKAKKHWNAIEVLLLKHPQIADSLNLVKRDTIRVAGLSDKIEAVNDSTIWGEGFFRDVDSLATEVVKAPEGKKVKPITRLQKKICPELALDSTYLLAVTYNNTTGPVKFWVPIRFAVRAADGRITALVDSKEVKMPDPEVVKRLVFQPTHPKFYLDQWFWVTVVLAILLFLSLMRKPSDRTAKPS